MKHIIIINPTAGVKNKTEVVKIEAMKYFRGLDYKIYSTKFIGDATEYVKNILEKNPDEQVRFYACGGDGTLNEVVNGVIGHPNAEVASYPIGSGNDYLKYYGKAEDFLNFKSLINGKVVESDILKFNERYVVNVFNVGLDANVVVYQRKYKRLPLVSGKAAYNLGVVTSLLNKISHKYKIKLDGEVLYDGKVVLCAVANSICYGGGYYCAPIAKVTDGKLDVCIVKKISRITFASLVKEYKAGKHLESPKVMKHIIYKQGKKVEIEIEKPLYYSVDGEMGKSNNIVIEVLDKALKFVVPNN